MKLKYTILLISFVLQNFTLHAQAQTVSYTASQEDIVNPDRGFYHPIFPAGDMNNFMPIDAADLISKRQTLFTPFSASYQIRTGLFFRYYILDNSTDDLSAFTLLLQQDFDGILHLFEFENKSVNCISKHAKICVLLCLWKKNAQNVFRKRKTTRHLQQHLRHTALS